MNNVYKYDILFLGGFVFKEAIENINVYIYCKNYFAKKRFIKLQKEILQPINLEEIKMLKEQSLIANNPYTAIEDNNIRKHFDIFKKTLTDRFGKESLINFYNNILWLNFSCNIVDRFTLTVLNNYGLYNIHDNKIKMLKKIDRHTLFHELFHSASTIVGNKEFCSGLSRRINERDIGDGLNEGYTDLMVSKYFDVRLNDENCFCSLVAIAKSLDYLIGKDKMEKFYLNADLHSLVQELSKYYFSEEISNFISTTDFLYYMLAKKYLSTDQLDVLYDIKEEIIKFITRGICLKLKDENKTLDEIKQIRESLFEDLFSYIDNQDYLKYIEEIVDEVISHYFYDENNIIKH